MKTDIKIIKNIKITQSLKTKLFAVILCVLIFNVLLSLILGTTLFDNLYTNDKISSLKNGVDEIKSSYQNKDINNLVDTIMAHENQNISVCIFSLDTQTGKGEVEYYSRQKYFDDKPIEKDILFLINRLWDDKAFLELSNKEYYIINDVNNRFDNNITILSNIEGNNYIIVQTPIKFIKDLSDMAIKYSLYISIFTLLIGAILIYFIAEKATKPIRKLQIIADKISNLDFKDRCDVLTDDEIGLLSKSINNMSEKLQDFVSQLMVANEKLKDDLIRQEKTDKMRKQFIANVSHDFKTPLTLIMSYSEALLDMNNIDEKTKKDYLNIIISEGNKMSIFVQELLKLSQLESGMIELTKSNFSINEIINDTIQKNKIITESKSLSIEKNIMDNFIVYADYYRIEQVFQNLFENGVKYAPNKSKIIISTEKHGIKCVVKIFNTGKIQEEDLENIFVSFYRADKSRKNMGSYGLGLAIVKVIMDMHGENYGCINKDNGVEFFFELQTADFDENNDDFYESDEFDEDESDELYESKELGYTNHDSDEMHVQNSEDENLNYEGVYDSHGK